MDNTYTHISMIIDRSGSMSSVWQDVVGGYEQIVKDNKALPGKCTFTVAVFDDQYTLVEDFQDIQKVDEKLKVSPRGSTALLDAIGKTIVSVGEKLAKMDEKDRPEKIVVFIQSDGNENASREFTRDSIKKLIDEHTNTYSWQFQFLGANLDSVNDAQSWGINIANTSVYNENNTGATFNMAASKMSAMRSATDFASYTAACAFSPEEKEILNK